MLNTIDNQGQHLHRTIGNTTCGDHKADIGAPCWVLPSNRSFGSFYYAICGKRIKKAGFIGKISPESIRTKAPVKSKDGERKPFKKKPNTRPLNFNGNK